MSAHDRATCHPQRIAGLKGAPPATTRLTKLGKYIFKDAERLIRPFGEEHK